MMMIRAGSGWVRAYRRGTGSWDDQGPEISSTAFSTGLRFRSQVSSPT